MEGLTVIRPAEGEKVVIHGEDGIGISLVNVSHVAVEGLEVEGGTHGICVYARNDLVPVEDITIEGCEVYDCECGSSESVVLNGVCTGNVVYNISTEGNKAYLEDWEYDLCAGGIYVDGGQNIEIYNNFIFKEECIFEHNTLVDNAAQIGVQRSRDNQISANLIVGGETAVEFNEYCRKMDMINDISGNAFCEIEDEESWTVEYGKMYEKRTEVIEGFRSLIDGTGSGFVPDGDLMELYNAQKRR